MKFLFNKIATKKTYILLNIIGPILLGIFVYTNCYPKLIRNYLPDGLWAYSFTSSIILIWDNTINYFWISSVFLIFIIFEILQYKGIINGTGDIRDVLVYIIFCIFTLIVNIVFKKNR